MKKVPKCGFKCHISVSFLIIKIKPQPHKSSQQKKQISNFVHQLLYN